MFDIVKMLERVMGWPYGPDRCVRDMQPYIAGQYWTQINNSFKAKLLPSKISGHWSIGQNIIEHCSTGLNITGYWGTGLNIIVHWSASLKITGH